MPEPASGTRLPVRPVARPTRVGAPPAQQRAIVQMPVASAPRSSWKRHLPLTFLLGTLAIVNLAGLPYYLLTTAQRVRHPFHPWLKPTGYIGQSAGIGAFLLFLFLWLYPLRKKFRWLAFTGSLAKWLDVHVLAGLCIPLLAALHASWQFSGLIGLGYAAMMVVVSSGFVGKYLYARIPRSRTGLEMSLEEIDTERRVLLKYVAGASGMSLEEVERILAPQPVAKAGRNPVTWIFMTIADDIDRWRAAGRLGRGMRRAHGQGKVDRRVLRLVRRIARRQMALSQQVRLLDATHRVFRYWHVAHRPVAITALLAVAVHVAVAVAMGVTWIL